MVETGAPPLNATGGPTRAAHHAAGAARCSGKPAGLRACGSATTPLAAHPISMYNCAG